MFLRIAERNDVTVYDLLTGLSPIQLVAQTSSILRQILDDANM